MYVMVQAISAPVTQRGIGSFCHLVKNSVLMTVGKWEIQAKQKVKRKRKWTHNPGRSDEEQQMKPSVTFHAVYTPWRVHCLTRRSKYARYWWGSLKRLWPVPHLKDQLLCPALQNRGSVWCRGSRRVNGEMNQSIKRKSNAKHFNNTCMSGITLIRSL